MSQQTITAVKLGRALMRGALFEASLWLGLIFVLSLILSAGDSRWHFIVRDDTDSAIERSGLRPLTDHRTGCQYLVNHDGSLTQRMGADGHQICGGAL